MWHVGRAARPAGPGGRGDGIAIATHPAPLTEPAACGLSCACLRAQERLGPRGPPGVHTGYGGNPHSRGGRRVVADFLDGNTSGVLEVQSSGSTVTDDNRAALEENNMASDSSTRPWWVRIHAAVVFGLSIGCAILVWLWWAWCGAEWAHQTIGKHAPSAASPPMAAGSSSAPMDRAAAPMPDRSAVMSELGQSGDAFGGANALFGAIAGGLLLWAGVLQARALYEARTAYEAERESVRRDQLSATFFRMLTLNRELVERIESGRKGNRVRSGAAALDSFAQRLHSKLSLQEWAPPLAESDCKLLATTYVDEVYRHHPSALGPYFRLLFQTFKLLADSKLTEDEQTRFANIARGQISEGAVLLLAANGLTFRGYDFVPLIEKFGLLEHLHPQYRQRYEQVLRASYRERAFLGSKDRQKYTWEPVPKFTRYQFSRVEVDAANVMEVDKEPT